MFRNFFRAQKSILVFLFPEFHSIWCQNRPNHGRFSATGLEHFPTTFGLQTSFSGPKMLVLCSEFFATPNFAFWSFCDSLIVSIGSSSRDLVFRRLESIKQSLWHRWYGVHTGFRKGANVVQSDWKAVPRTITKPR